MLHSEIDLDDILKRANTSILKHFKKMPKA